MEKDTPGLRKRMQKKAAGGGVCAVIENKRSHLLPRGGPLWAEPTSD